MFDFGYFLDPKSISNDQVGSIPCPDHEYLGLTKETQDKKHPKI